MTITLESIVSHPVAKTKDIPGYINQTKLFAEAKLDRFANRFGFLSYNPKARIATFLHAFDSSINLVAIDPDGNKLLELREAHDHGKQHISDSGNLIAFTRSDNGVETLCVYDLKHAELRVLDSRPGDYSLFTFTADERNLHCRFSSSDEGGNVYDYCLSDGSKNKLTDYPLPPGFPPVEKLTLDGIPVFLHKPGFGLGYGSRIVLRSQRAFKREKENIQKMKELREKGFSYWKIADVLNSMKVPTQTRRGKWHAKTVHQILDRAQ